MTSTSTLNRAKVEDVQVGLYELKTIRVKRALRIDRRRDYEALTEYAYVLKVECESGIDESCGELKELLFGD